MNILPAVDEELISGSSLIQQVWHYPPVLAIRHSIFMPVTILNSLLNLAVPGSSVPVSSFLRSLRSCGTRALCWGGEHHSHADGQFFQSARATGKLGRQLEAGSPLIASPLLRGLSQYHLGIAVGAASMWNEGFVLSPGVRAS